MSTDPRHLLRFAPHSARWPIHRAIHVHDKLVELLVDRFRELARLPDSQPHEARELLLRVGERALLGEAALSEALHAWRLGRVSDHSLRREAARIENAGCDLLRELRAGWPKAPDVRASR